MFFVWKRLSGYSSCFEKPFLAGSHRLGVWREVEYKTFVMMKKMSLISALDILMKSCRF